MLVQSALLLGRRVQLRVRWLLLGRPLVHAFSLTSIVSVVSLAFSNFNFNLRHSRHQNLGFQIGNDVFGCFQIRILVIYSVIIRQRLLNFRVNFDLVYRILIYRCRIQAVFLFSERRDVSVLVCLNLDSSSFRVLVRLVLRRREHSRHVLVRDAISYRVFP